MAHANEDLMLKPTRTIVLLLACAAILPAAGCARNKAKGDTAYVARDVNTLYSAAKRTMDNGDYLQAAKLFDEVERQHPYSVWARRAQIMRGRCSAWRMRFRRRKSVNSRHG